MLLDILKQNKRVTLKRNRQILDEPVPRSAADDEVHLFLVCLLSHELTILIRVREHEALDLKFGYVLLLHQLGRGYDSMSLAKHALDGPLVIYGSVESASGANPIFAVIELTHDSRETLRMEGMSLVADYYFELLEPFFGEFDGRLPRGDDDLRFGFSFLAGEDFVDVSGPTWTFVRVSVVGAGDHSTLFGTCGITVVFEVSRELVDQRDRRNDDKRLSIIVPR